MYENVVAVPEGEGGFDAVRVKPSVTDLEALRVVCVVWLAAAWVGSVSHVAWILKRRHVELVLGAWQRQW